MIEKPSNKIPKPSAKAIAKLLHEHIPSSMGGGGEVKTGIHAPPEWLVAIVVIAYQSGRYDEASAETFAASFD